MHGVASVGKRQNNGKGGFALIDFGGKGPGFFPRTINIGFSGGGITLIHGIILARRQGKI